MHKRKENGKKKCLPSEKRHLPKRKKKKKNKHLPSAKIMTLGNAKKRHSVMQKKTLGKEFL